MLARKILAFGNQLRRSSAQCARTICTTPPKLTQNLPVPANTEAIKKIDNLVSKSAEGRLFAVVHLCGKQFRVTDGDIIMIEGYWPPTVGDKIRLDKVLLAGGKDFSLIGTPMLQQGLVDVQATVIEKTMSNTKTNFKKKKTKQYMRINFVRCQLTMVRINSIAIQKAITEASKTVEKESQRVF